MNNEVPTERTSAGKKYSIIYIVVAATLWGTIGLFVRYLSGLGFSSYHLIVFRTLITSVSLFGYLAIFDRQKLKLRPRDIWFFVLAAGVTVTCFNLCYFNAIKYTGMSVASVLLYTAPIFVTLFSFALFGEKLTATKLVALCLALLGCVFVSGVIGSDGVNFVGILLGLGAGITYASYSIFSKLALGKAELRVWCKRTKNDISGDETPENEEPKRRFLSTYSPLTFTAYLSLIGGLLMLPFCRFTGIGVTLTARWYIIPLIILFAVVTNLVPYVLYTKGLETVEAGRASITATVEPIVATILGVLVFHEKLTALGGVGIGLVLFSAVILNIKFKRPRISVFKRAKHSDN